ncbi:sortilin-like [Pomacea canaliculata]|uniref:sortilin-like n=1 Tax=Pomacea canaliculata TaxID=400727 RepID=UPI000D72D46A|nr:sortilin-like [Pomacea canaliculata]
MEMGLLVFGTVVFLTILCSSSSVPTTIKFNALDRKERSSDVLPNYDSSKLSHVKRSTETSSEKKDPKCEAQKTIFSNAVSGGKRLETTHVFINESNFNLALAWAGNDDDGTLIVLTTETSNSQSTLWRSTDHGRTWKNINDHVDNATFRKADGLQRNPHNPKWVYLISHDRFLYKTQDGGETWKKVMLDAIVQEELIFHDDGIYKDHIMIITYERKLLVTRDNFDSIEKAKEGQVHIAHWGTVASKSPGVIYAALSDSQGSFFLDDFISLYDLQRYDRESGEGSWKSVLKNVYDFGVQGSFFYASVYSSDHPTMASERLLKVSNDAGSSWSEAQLPTITNDRFFSVLDMSEKLIFMHVDNPGDTGHGTLYTSSSMGLLYSESLQRHLYPNYNSITDFYKVSSMRGTYIASQLNEDNSIHSVITFNRGAQWQPVPKPEEIVCKDNAEKCTLQIHNAYSIHRGVTAHPPLSQEDAVGIILVNAHAAQNLQTTDPDVFISSDGGYSWRKALDGPHSYVVADSGGLLVAIPLNVSEPDTIKFSTDEGRCWHEYKFTNESIHHTGLLTEPGGKSMTVAIWGYTVADKKWTVNVIDFTDVVPKQCASDDYDDWKAHETLRQEEKSDVEGCLLGMQVTFKRLKADSWCHNGYDYKPVAEGKICHCTYADFECDYGYYRPNGQQECVIQPEFKGREIDVCFRGHEQKIISEGYRKIPGDVCNESQGFKPSSRYINLTETCNQRLKPVDLPVVEEHLKLTENKPHSSWTLILTITGIAVILLAVVVVYFAYKMVLLRRHKVVYRYSMLSQNEDKDIDDEIERTLIERPVVFGDISDEEELPAQPQNGHVQRDRMELPQSYHDDSDDDMLK